MDTDRFDALTKLLAHTRSRRGATATLITLAGMGLTAPFSADAKKKKKRKKKTAPIVPPPPPPASPPPPPPPPACTGKLVSQTCTEASECCSNQCEEIDAPCSHFGTICCAALRAACQTDCECCKVELFNVECDTNPARRTCCLGIQRHGCTTREDCCLYDNPPYSDIICSSRGICCLPLGAACTFDIECCQNATGPQNVCDQGHCKAP